jgi:hypothetical protein
MFLRWAGPWPHIPFPPDLILYVNLVAMGPVHLSPVTCPPDSANAYSRTTASYRLTQLFRQKLESSQFLGASKLPLLEWTSLNAGTLTHTYSVSITP